jgi:UDP-N-acetylmuramyl pentapeptide phosphotransferase/UDP-N-acetylglucosamine-1-phosphate transferase
MNNLWNFHGAFSDDVKNITQQKKLCSHMISCVGQFIQLVGAQSICRLLMMNRSQFIILILPENFIFEFLLQVFICINVSLNMQHTRLLH